MTKHHTNVGRLNLNVTLSYCLNNVDVDTRARLKRHRPRVIEDVCLQRCGECFAGAFWLEGQRLTRAPDHTPLLAWLDSQRDLLEGQA